MEVMHVSSVWKVKPSDALGDTQFVSSPNDPICWIELIEPESSQVICLLSVMYQQRHKGIFQAAVVPSSAHIMNKIPKQYWKLVADKFDREVWQPFLRTEGGK